MGKGSNQTHTQNLQTNSIRSIKQNKTKGVDTYYKKKIPIMQKKNLD